MLKDWPFLGKTVRQDGVAPSKKLKILSLVTLSNSASQTRSDVHNEDGKYISPLQKGFLTTFYWWQRLLMPE